MGVSRKELAEKKHGGLLNRSFLTHLRPGEQDQMLASMDWRQYQPGDRIIELEGQGDGVELLVSGRASVLVPGDDGELVVRATSGEGALMGERALYYKIPTSAEVRAQTEVTTLHLPAEAFYRSLQQIPSFAEHIEHLVSLRAEWPTLKEILDHNPFLSFLQRRELEQLLASGQLVSVAAGEHLIHAGEITKDVYVVIRGTLEVYSAEQPDNPRRLLSVQRPGELNGIAAVMLELPRIADVVARDNTELLKIQGGTFINVVNANPPVRRRLMQYLATLNFESVSAVQQKASRMVVFVCGARRGMGATTLSYGVATNLQGLDPVTLVDLEGERTAASLNLKVTDGELCGIPVRLMQAPASWNMRVVWPRPGEDPRPFLRALRDEVHQGRTDNRVMVSGEPGELMRDSVLEEVDAIVHVRRASDSGDPPEGRGKALFQAIRIEEGVPIDLQTSMKAVRLPEDSSGAATFWRTGSLRYLEAARSPLGATAARLARLLRGRSVGLALGGGGALGFSHIGLLRVLERANIPIDYVAGVSFGSIVAAVYAGGGLKTLELLIRQRRRLALNVLACLATTNGIGRHVDRITGHLHLGETEIPFFPVGLDMESGQEYVLPDGTLGEGVRSSSCMPGVFPAMNHGGKRLVDGGVINNVPATVAWQAGADFIIASNVIPSNPLSGRGIMGRIPHGKRLLSGSLGRVDDLLGAMYTLMSQTGRDRALMADYVFDPELQNWDAYDFLDGDLIADVGQAEAEDRLPAIRKAYEKDRSIRF